MHPSTHRTAPVALLALLLLGTISLGRANASTDTIAQLRDQLRALEQKILILERQQELRDEAAATVAKSTPTLAAGPGGFSITSADRGFQLRIRANLQVDGRFFLGDSIEGNDTFLIRRLRPSFEGTVGTKYAFRLMPDFAPSTFNLLDAYATYTHSPAFNLLVGKTKTPFDLERLVSQTDLLFIERAYPTSLGPNRDLGVQVFGDLSEGRLSYQLALQNSVPDGGTSIVDTDDAKEIAARIFTQPFKGDGSALEGLGLGIAVTTGEQNVGTPAVLRTNAQQAFFAWAPGVLNAGRHERVSPQFHYYHGPSGSSARTFPLGRPSPVRVRRAISLPAHGSSERTGCSRAKTRARAGSRRGPRSRGRTARGEHGKRRSAMVDFESATKPSPAPRPAGSPTLQPRHPKHAEPRLALTGT